MPVDNPLQFSQLLLTALGTRTYLYHQDRVPRESALLVVSNHRSFMDAPLLMAAINRPIRFACHHYMGQVPVLRDIVTRLGCFPLEIPQQRQHSFFQQATRFLQTRQAVGVFPEGADPMIRRTHPQEISDFQRGFAHLALRTSVQDLAVLPVAIASCHEHSDAAFPLRLLSWFDPSEPLFNQEGWHPMVLYRRVNLLVGRPFWITPHHRTTYQGKRARAMANELTHYCHDEIEALLKRGCY